MSLWYFPGGVAPDARRRRLQLQPLPPVDRSTRATGSAPACARSGGSPSPSSPSSASACCSSAATASPTLDARQQLPRRRRRTATGAGTTGSSRRSSSSSCSSTCCWPSAPVRRFERRFPYLFPLLLFGGALVFRYHWADHRRVRQPALPDPRRRLVLPARLARPPVDDADRRLLTTALCLLTIPGFFGRPGAGVVHRPRHRRCSSGAATCRCPASPSARSPSSPPPACGSSSATSGSGRRSIATCRPASPTRSTIVAGVAIWCTSTWAVRLLRLARRAAPRAELWVREETRVLPIPSR